MKILRYPDSLLGPGWRVRSPPEQYRRSPGDPEAASPDAADCPAARRSRLTAPVRAAAAFAAAHGYSANAKMGLLVHRL